MNIDTTLTDDYAVLTLKGEFDTFHCPRFQEEIEDILERDLVFIILNMRMVKFINSTALGAIIKASKMCKADDGELVLSAPSPFVKDIVHKLGIDQMVPVFDDEEGAKKHIIKTLNAQAMAEGASVREEKVLIIFPDNTRNQQIGGKKALVGTMSSVDSERVRFLWSGEKLGISADQGKQLFYPGSELHLKFQVKMFKKGHFEVTAAVDDVEVASDDNLRITAAFKKIKPREREALAQFAADMDFLKRQIREQ
ncbi:MAG: STAS domain-containing protein [Planctomycetes bacterium]|nr:STAS domain-containing protein [Planctomycetota bacterium]